MQARKMPRHAKLQKPQKTASSLSSIMSSVWFKSVPLTPELLSRLVFKRANIKLQYLCVRHEAFHLTLCGCAERERKKAASKGKLNKEKERKAEGEAASEKGKHLKSETEKREVPGDNQRRRRLWDNTASCVQRRSSVRMPGIPQIRPRVVCSA